LAGEFSYSLNRKNNLYKWQLGEENIVYSLRELFLNYY